MNHSYYLNRMPLGLRSEIEAAPIYATWIKQGSTLEQIWCDLDRMKLIYNQLSVQESRLLLLIVTYIGCEPFDWAKFERLAFPSMSIAESRVGLLLLLKKGLLYAFRKSWGEQLYVMAHDGLTIWQQMMWPNAAELSLILNDEAKAGSNDFLAVELTDQGGVGLGDVIFQSMVFISRNEMRRTKQGTLHKRLLQKWQQSLSLGDDWFKGCDLKHTFADVYSESMAIVLDFLIRLDIIEWSGEELKLYDEGAKCWLILSAAEQDKRLYMLWKQQVFPSESWLQHVALLFERQPEGVWISLEHVLQWMRNRKLLQITSSCAQDEYWIRQLEARWLHPLLAFGWLEMGSCQGEGHDRLYRWSKHPLAAANMTGDVEGYFYVQPDFEVLVPPDVGFAVRWELSAIANHLHSDSMSLYNITKESLQRGVENGRQLEQILGFLKRHAAYGIPDHVQSIVEQWAKPMDSIISRSENGLYKPVMINTEELVEREIVEWQQSASGDGFIQSRHAFLQLEMERKLHAVEELYPNLNGVPTAWMKEYRMYHLSTRRELIEKALEWRTSLQIRVNVTDRIIIPNKLQETGGKWAITANEGPDGKEISLFLSDWEGMRIIVPGLDEK